MESLLSHIHLLKVYLWSHWLTAQPFAAPLGQQKGDHISKPYVFVYVAIITPTAFWWVSWACLLMSAPWFILTVPSFPLCLISMCHNSNCFSYLDDTTVIEHHTCFLLLTEQSWASHFFWMRVTCPCSHLSMKILTIASQEHSGKIIMWHRQQDQQGTHHAIDV